MGMITSFVNKLEMAEKAVFLVYIRATSRIVCVHFRLSSEVRLGSSSFRIRRCCVTVRIDDIG